MENMPIQVGVLDLVLAGLLLLFLLRGLVRGIVPELGGVLSILLAVLASGSRPVHERATGWFDAILTDQGWSDLAAYVSVFLVVFILMRMLFQILERLTSEKAPGWLDRGLGAIAGAVKGIVGCTLILVCLSYVAPESDLRQSSMLAPYFNEFWAGVSELTGGAHKLPRM